MTQRPPARAENLTIRDMKAGEEPLLWQVFHSSVHELASRYYTHAQVQAWSPGDLDPDFWARRMASIRPYVAVADGRIVGYTDLQPSGYIDHFFVAGAVPRRGIGTALMNHSLALANQWHVRTLSSHVSLAAQAFYKKFGFQVAEVQSVTVRGVDIQHALMMLEL